MDQRHCWAALRPAALPWLGAGGGAVRPGAGPAALPLRADTATFAGAAECGSGETSPLQAGAGRTRTPGQRAEVLRAGAGQGVSRSTGQLTRAKKTELCPGQVCTDPWPVWTPGPVLSAHRQATHGCAWVCACVGSDSRHYAGSQPAPAPTRACLFMKPEGKCLISRLIAWVIGRRTQLSK